MTTAQVLVMVAVMALATIFTRVLPFLLFPSGKKTPKFVDYLGSVLPCAVIGMLVVYCFKGVTVTAWPFGIPEALSGSFVVAIHKWKHNLLLSIGGGTALYMALVQLVF